MCITESWPSSRVQKFYFSEKLLRNVKEIEIPDLVIPFKTNNLRSILINKAFSQHWLYFSDDLNFLLRENWKRDKEFVLPELSF